jgi:hypothetical protein
MRFLRMFAVADALAERDKDEFTRARLRKQASLRHEETMELRRLIKEFDDFADTLLPADNVADDNYPDCCGSTVASCCDSVVGCHLDVGNRPADRMPQGLLRRDAACLVSAVLFPYGTTWKA